MLPVMLPIVTILLTGLAIQARRPHRASEPVRVPVRRAGLRR